MAGSGGPGNKRMKDASMAAAMRVGEGGRRCKGCNAIERDRARCPICNTIVSLDHYPTHVGLHK